MNRVQCWDRFVGAVERTHYISKLSLTAIIYTANTEVKISAMGFEYKFRDLLFEKYFYFKLHLYVAFGVISISVICYICDHVHTAPAPTPDMNDLTGALHYTVADKWEHIGIYLHLPMAALKTIAAEHQHDPHKCLIGMLGVWLKRVDPPPIWTAIIEAVEFLGEEQLARQLREKYCPQIYEI